MTNPLTHLHRFIVAHFDREELRSLCFDLSVDYDSLPGKGKAGKARELILWVGRQRKLDRLLATLRQSRLDSFDQAGFSANPAVVEALYVELPTFAARDENLRDQELAYLDDLLARYEYWLDHYTPLAGIAEVRAAVKDGPRLDLPMPFIPPGFEKLVEHGYGERIEERREPVDDLRAAVAEHQRIVLLGDPGSGKTTTLWRLAYDYAVAAREDSQAPLPVFVPLGGCTDDDPFDAYLARHLGTLATHLESYRSSGRLVLLLDGINEMPQAKSDALVRRIQAVLDRQPDEMVVITCRTLDYVVELEQLQKVEISPLDEPRIHTFLHNYLGDIAGERLFWTMAEDEARDLRQEPSPLLALGRNPYLLLVMAQIYAGSGGKLPTNREQLLAAFVDTLLGREEKRHHEGWIEAQRQKDALVALARAMQAERGRGTTVDRDWAVTQLGRAVPDCDTERLLYLATSAMLLDTDDATVRFYHQLLQDYFTDRVFLDEINNLNRGPSRVDGFPATVSRMIRQDQELDMFQLVSSYFIEGGYDGRDGSQSYYFESEVFLPVIEELRTNGSATIGSIGIQVVIENRWDHSYSFDDEGYASVQRGCVNGILRLDGCVFAEYDLNFTPKGVKKVFKSDVRNVINEDIRPIISSLR